jgi:hypothetical protein
MISNLVPQYLSQEFQLMKQEFNHLVPQEATLAQKKNKQLKYDYCVGKAIKLPQVSINNVRLSFLYKISISKNYQNLSIFLRK